MQGPESLGSARSLLERRKGERNFLAPEIDFRAGQEVYAANDSKETFVKDFVSA